MDVLDTTRVWAEVDPAAFRHNVEAARRLSGTELIAVVKADAYGHGVDMAVPALRELAALFAVANVEEAAVVRALAPEKDVLLLSPCLPAERAAAVESRCIATVSSADEARHFAGGRVSLKVDTGMGRIGVWRPQALAEVEAIVKLSGVALHSVATHLPVPDEDEAFTRSQLGEFSEFIARIRTVAPGVKYHALNSAGICGYPEYAFDLVRAGLMLYGSASIASFQPRLRPALAWKTRVLLVRDVPAGRGISYGRTFITPRSMRVATLAVGYADGYPRQASNRGASVLIAGRLCALLGRVTMDQILVDVSGAPNVKIGDEAVLLGSQGGATILAAELAGWAGTIAWHIFTGIGGRTKRMLLTRRREDAGIS
ncbi:MAG: alanine racemase [Terrimicrobiaceae bacterium]|nr:alanine racemase [Terrimicrobiaceae bacterium]